MASINFEGEDLQELLTLLPEQHPDDAPELDWMKRDAPSRRGERDELLD